MVGFTRLATASFAVLLATTATVALGPSQASASSVGSASARAPISAGASSTTASPTAAGSSPTGSSPTGSTPASSTSTGPISTGPASTPSSATGPHSAPASTAQPTGSPAHPTKSSPAPSRDKSAQPQDKALAAAGSPDLGAAGAYLTKPSLLLDGHYYEAFPNSGGFADFGLTIDGALALAASRTDDPALANIVDWLNGNGTDGQGRTIDAWTGIGTQYVSGGSLGKEALLALATGYNPRAFGGHDLIAALDDSICSTSVSDDACAAEGNYAYSNSVFAQALGVLAQLRSGDQAHAGKPITFLESLQNQDGSFPSLIPSSGGSDVDSTAMAAMALALVPGQQTAVTQALSWLASEQLPGGGFPGAAGDSVNSAALALQGLSLNAAAYRTQIASARAFLAGQQNADGGFNAAAGTPPSDLRASTQAVSGSTGISFATLYLDLPSAAAASKGAAFLVSQLVGGDHLANDYGPDYGLTADLALALAAVHDQDAVLAKVTGYLRAHVADYADPSGTGKYPGPYSGATAKLALLAEVTGQDPRAFGGFDLLKVLTDNVCAAADRTGYLCTAPGDFTQSYSTVSQALGVLALARGGVTPPPAALARLKQLQCGDGGFSSTLLAAGGTCTSDVDTTGYAAQALSLVPAAAGAVDAARTYLLDAQQPDGGFVGAAGESANSAGLAGQALLAIGIQAQPAALGQPRAVPAGTDPIAAAKAFLVSQQLSNGAFKVSTTKTAADVRATTQAVPALAGVVLTSLADPITPVTPAAPVTPPSTGASHPSTGTSAAGVGSAGNPGQSAAALASTGASTTQPLLWALVLLLAGAAAMLAGSRRRFPVALGFRRGRRH